MKTTLKDQTCEFYTKHKLLLISGGVVLVIAGVSWYVYQQQKEKQKYTTALTTLNPKKSKQATPGKFVCTSSAYPLAYGTCHKDVFTLQKFLRLQGARLGTSGKKRDGVDGKFGKLTKSASLKYLKKSIIHQKDIRGIQTALNLLRP